MADTLNTLIKEYKLELKKIPRSFDFTTLNAFDFEAFDRFLDLIGIAYPHFHHLERFLAARFLDQSRIFSTTEACSYLKKVSMKKTDFYYLCDQANESSIKIVLNKELISELFDSRTVAADAAAYILKGEMRKTQLLFARIFEEESELETLRSKLSQGIPVDTLNKRIASHFEKLGLDLMRTALLPGDNMIIYDNTVCSGPATVHTISLIPLN